MTDKSAVTALSDFLPDNQEEAADLAAIILKTHTIIGRLESVTPHYQNSIKEHLAAILDLANCRTGELKSVAYTAKSSKRLSKVLGQ